MTVENINSEGLPITSASESMLPHSSNKVKTKTQERSTDSNRYILAAALESAVKNPIEQKYLTEYKEAVSKIDALESHLQNVNAEIGELRFTKGKYDKEKIRKLSEDATKTAMRHKIKKVVLQRYKTEKSCLC